MLENAILKLAVKAGDAMPAGGRLTIETTNADVDTFYAKSADIEPGQYVLLAITDTGEAWMLRLCDRRSSHSSQPSL